MSDRRRSSFFKVSGRYRGRGDSAIDSRTYQTYGSLYLGPVVFCDATKLIDLVG